MSIVLFDSWPPGPALEAYEKSCEAAELIEEWKHMTGPRLKDEDFIEYAEDRYDDNEDDKPF